MILGRKLLNKLDAMLDDYNVFQISVANDIRFYGLLKTIGVTGRQLKRIIRLQALALSGLGVPLGLLIGFFLGAALTPTVLSTVEGVNLDDVSTNPLIFIGSTLFSLYTVMISCRRPGKIAAKTSPLEAVRYNEVNGIKTNLRKGKKGALLSRIGSRSIAAVYETDDYDNLIPASHWAKVGDRITLRRVDEWEYFDPDTGEIFESVPETAHYRVRAKSYEDLICCTLIRIVIPK